MPKISMQISTEQMLLMLNMKQLLFFGALAFAISTKVFKPTFKL